MRRMVIALAAAGVGGLVLAGVLIAGPALLRQVSGPASDAAALERLDVYAQVPDFSLLERSGRTVERADLLGKVWLLNFIYTKCTETCPTQSLQIARLATEFARATGDGYHQALSSLDLSEIYLELNLGIEARTLAEDARARFLRLGNGYEAAKALVRSAIAVGQDGWGASALQLFERARTELVREQNRVWPAVIDLYRAILLFQLGHIREAQQMCAGSLDFFEAAGLRRKAALCRLLLARIELRLGNMHEAREHCESVLDPASVGTPTLAYHAYLVLGDVELESGERPRAYNSYQAARGALETVRSRLPKTLRAEPACDAPEGPSHERVSVAATAERGPWQLTWERRGTQWRLIQAAPIGP